MKPIIKTIMPYVIDTLVWAAAFGIAAIVPILYNNVGPNMIYQNYKQKYEKFMNLVDSNQNGIVNFEEQVDAWKRMGYKSPFSESGFPKPNISELEKAIKNYERKN